MASGSSMNPFKIIVFLIVFLVGKIVSGTFAFGDVFLFSCPWEEFTESLDLVLLDEFVSAKRYEEHRTRMMIAGESGYLYIFELSVHHQIASKAKEIRVSLILEFLFEIE